MSGETLAYLVLAVLAVVGWTMAYREHQRYVRYRRRITRRARLVCRRQRRPAKR